MRKTNRNDPCPCGSGKKYKRCCGVVNDINSKVQSINDVLYRMHQELISIATNKYNTKLHEQLTQFNSSVSQDQETISIYHSGLAPWIVANVPCLDNKETIFERYFRKIQSKISPLAKSIIVKWPHVIPSVYEIISIDSPKQNFLHLREISTKETFDVPFQRTDHNFTEGSLLIGMLIPFVQHDNFLFSMVTLYDRDTQFYIELLEAFSKKEGGLTTHFPSFLAEALHNGMMELAWNNPIHEEVADLFAEQMENKQLSEEAIVNGISLWNNFCEKEDPAIQKIEPYAAALDYYIQKELLQDADVKQVQVAEQYSTSPSTLSRIYRNMVNVLQAE